jgi:hypothetical protein
MPPGSGGSKVAYGSQTQIGTTTTMQQSFTNDASAQVNGGSDKGTVSDSITFGSSFGGTTSTSVDIENTSAANQSWTGPASNAIDHDFDIIVLYTHVFVTFSTDYLGHITWSLDFSQITSSQLGYWANVGCLNPNSAVYQSAICTSQGTELNGLGVTVDMFSDILAADPFWDPNNQPQSLATTTGPLAGRYISLLPTSLDPNNTPSVPYQPGFGNGTVAVTDTNFQNVTNTTIATDSHSTGFSITAGVPDVAKLTISDKVTITNTATSSNHTATTDTSMFTISMPTSTQSNPYTGPPTLYIYMDTVYKTFMFSFIPTGQ